jgi:hypothetical protein
VAFTDLCTLEGYWLPNSAMGEDYQAPNILSKLFLKLLDYTPSISSPAHPIPQITPADTLQQSQDHDHPD